MLALSNPHFFELQWSASLHLHMRLARQMPQQSVRVASKWQVACLKATPPWHWAMRLVSPFITSNTILISACFLSHYTLSPPPCFSCHVSLRPHHLLKASYVKCCQLTTGSSGTWGSQSSGPPQNTQRLCCWQHVGKAGFSRQRKTAVTLGR